MGPVEPTTTGNIDGSASNGTMDGKQGEGSTKITTACITISSNQSDSSMQSDEAGQGDVHVSSERPMSGQRALHGEASDHQSGAGEAVSTPSRLDDSLIGSYTAPQQQLPSEPNGKHSWEAELSFEMSSDSHGGSAAEPAAATAAVAGQGGASRQSGSNHGEPQFEGGEIENEPRVRQDVARESDRRDDEELPEQGLAQSLLSRFKDIESEAQQVKQTEHRPSGVAVKATPTPLRPATRQVPEDAIDGGGGANDFHRPQEKAEVENEPVVRTDVVKESDTNVAEELPERGMARNLLSKFKTMEVEAQQRSEYKPSGVSARIWKGTSGQSPSLSLSSSAGPHREPAFEGGDLENTPHVRTDVVRESDGSVEEELPERGLAQSLLSRFKTLESEATKKQEYRPSGVAHKATPSKMHIMAGRSVYVPDGTTKGSPSGGADAGASSEVHEPQFEGGEFENTPEVRADVIKESDRALDEDLPQQGLAKNLLTRFKSIEAEASVQKDYVPSGVGSKPTPTPLSLANTAVGRRAVLSAYESSADSRGSSSERDFASAAYSDSAAVAANGGEYENEPAPRPEGVVSSTDRNDADELPENGLAQSVLSKFKSLEAQKASDYQPSGVGSKAVDAPVVLRDASRPEYDLAEGVSCEVPVGHLAEAWQSNVRSSSDDLVNVGVVESKCFAEGSRLTQPTGQDGSGGAKLMCLGGIFSSTECVPNPTTAIEDSSSHTPASCSSFLQAVAPSDGSSTMTFGQVELPAAAAVAPVSLPASVFYPDKTTGSFPDDSMVPSVLPEETRLHSPTPPSMHPRHDLPNPTASNAQLLGGGMSSYSWGDHSSCMAPHPTLMAVKPVFSPCDVNMPASVYAYVAPDLDESILAASIVIPLSVPIDDRMQWPQSGSNSDLCSSSRSAVSSSDIERELIGSTLPASPELPSPSDSDRTLELGAESEGYVATVSSWSAEGAAEDAALDVVPLEDNGSFELVGSSEQVLTIAGSPYIINATVPGVMNPDDLTLRAADQLVTSDSEQLCNVADDLHADLDCSCCARHGTTICPGIIMDVLMYGSRAQDKCTHCSSEDKAFSHSLFNAGESACLDTEMSQSSINLTFPGEKSKMSAEDDDKCCLKTSSDASTLVNSTQSSTSIGRSDYGNVYTSSLQLEKGCDDLDDFATVVGTNCTNLTDGHSDDDDIVLQLENQSECGNLLTTFLHNCQPGDKNHVRKTKIQDESLQALIPQDNTLDGDTGIAAEAEDSNVPCEKIMHQKDQSELALQPTTNPLAPLLQAESGMMCSTQASRQVELESVQAGSSPYGQLCSIVPGQLIISSSDDEGARAGSSSSSEESMLLFFPQASAVESDGCAGLSGRFPLNQSHSHATVVAGEVPGTSSGGAVTLHVVPEGTGIISATPAISFQSKCNEACSEAGGSQAEGDAVESDDMMQQVQAHEACQSGKASALVSDGHDFTENTGMHLIDGAQRMAELWSRPDSLTFRHDSVLLSDFTSTGVLADGVSNVACQLISSCRSPPSTPVNPDDNPATCQLAEKNFVDGNSHLLAEFRIDGVKIGAFFQTYLSDDYMHSFQGQGVAQTSAAEQVDSNNAGPIQSNFLDEERAHARGVCMPHESSLDSADLCGGGVDSLSSSAAIVVQLAELEIPVDGESPCGSTAVALHAVISTAETNVNSPQLHQPHSEQSLLESHPQSIGEPNAYTGVSGCDSALESLQLLKSDDNLVKLDVARAFNDSGSDPTLSCTATSPLVTEGKEVVSIYTESKAIQNPCQAEPVPMQGADPLEIHNVREYGAVSDATFCFALDSDQVQHSEHTSMNADSIASTPTYTECQNHDRDESSQDGMEKQSQTEHSAPHLETVTIQLYDCLTDCGTIPDLTTTGVVTVSSTEAMLESAETSVPGYQNHGTRCHQPSQLTDNTSEVIAESYSSDDNTAHGSHANFGGLYSGCDRRSIFAGIASLQDSVSTDRSTTTLVDSELSESAALANVSLLLQDTNSSCELSSSAQNCTNLSDQIVSPTMASYDESLQSIADKPKQGGLQSNSVDKCVEGDDTTMILKIPSVLYADTDCSSTLMPSAVASVVIVSPLDAVYTSEQTSSGLAVPSTTASTNDVSRSQSFETACEEIVFALIPSDPVAVRGPVSPKVGAYPRQIELAKSSLDQTHEQSFHPELCSSSTTNHLPNESILAQSSDIETTTKSGSLSRNDVLYDLRQHPGSLSDIDPFSSSAGVSSLEAADLSAGEPISTETQPIANQQLAQIADTVFCIESEERQEAGDSFTPTESAATADLVSGPTEVSGASSSGLTSEQIADHVDMQPSSRPA